MSELESGLIDSKMRERGYCIQAAGPHVVMGPDHTCQRCGAHCPSPRALTDDEKVKLVEAGRMIKAEADMAATVKGLNEGQRLMDEFKAKVQASTCLDLSPQLGPNVKTGIEMLCHNCDTPMLMRDGPSIPDELLEAMGGFFAVCPKCKCVELEQTVMRHRAKIASINAADPPYYGCQGCNLTWVNVAEYSRHQYPTKGGHGMNCDKWDSPSIPVYKFNRESSSDNGSRDEWLISIGRAEKNTERTTFESVDRLSKPITPADEVRAALNEVIAAELAFRDVGKTRAAAYDRFDAALKKLSSGK